MTASPSTSVEAESFTECVRRAREGDDMAWERLVFRLRRAAWKAIVAFDLQPQEQDDAFAATFMRLYEHLGSIREPEKLPGWVTTVARNETFALLRSRRRSTELVHALAQSASEETSGQEVDDGALHLAVRVALESLPELSQQLMRLVTADPPVPYAEISLRLGLPIGAIGPTRQRCLERMRRHPELVRYLASVR
jgi:RNA polymerase sigma factor (sigma-70 family)